MLHLERLRARNGAGSQDEGGATGKGDIMSERVDTFCNNLKDQLNSIEEHVNQVKENLEAARTENEETVRRKIEQARNALEEKKSERDEAFDKLKARIEEARATVRAKVDEWKKGMETRKLAGRADDAEQYAAGAIEAAKRAIREAEVATLEAISARRDAETSGQKAA
jgi:DNA anti-recombination protein RmuC